jgi:NTE family protein
MAKTKIAIACQGGGSQTAFTAGALKTLSEARLQDEFELVSISGTSGGALCAALVWDAHIKQEQPRWGRLMAFWKDNTAQGWAEELLEETLVNTMRLINTGVLPSFQVSPAEPMMQQMMTAMTFGRRRTFRPRSTTKARSTGVPPTSIT